MATREELIAVLWERLKDKSITPEEYARDRARIANLEERSE